MISDYSYEKWMEIINRNIALKKYTLYENVYLLNKIPEKHQTEELVLEIFKINPKITEKFFRYTLSERNQTERICIEAVKQNGMVLSKVVNQTEKICLEAVRQNGLAIRFVNDRFKTKELCKIAVENNVKSIKYMKEELSYDIYLSAVKSIINKIPECNNKIKEYKNKFIKLIDNEMK